MALASLVYSDGRGRLRVAEPSLAGESSVVLAAGPVLRFDPVHPDRLLAVELPRDVEPQDLAGVLRLRADIAAGFDPESDARAIAAIDHGDLLTGVQRLAFAQWHARWTPLDIERPLVMLDIATASWLAIAGERLRAVELFNEHAGFLLDLARDEADKGPVCPFAGASIQQTAAACAAALPDDPRRDELLQACASLRTADLAIREPMTPGVRGLGPGDAPTGAEVGLGSVDWVNVPPRTLHTDEGHLTWTAAPSERGVAYAVMAVAHPQLRPGSLAAARLIVRLVDPTTGRVAAAAPLPLGDKDSLGRPVFAATVDVPAADASPGLVPDVVDARVVMRRAARTGEEAWRARAERTAIRALAWSRLESAVARASPTWAPLFTRAESERNALLDLAAPMHGTAAAASRDWLAEVRQGGGTHIDSIPAAPLLSEWIAISRIVRQATF